jgi:hypothetical protein
MKQWLNPLLQCEPVGIWSVDVGSQFRFYLRIPFLNPALDCTVCDRQEGLVVWKFEGFFSGDDRWECQPHPTGTLLINRFRFDIPNPLVRQGFDRFAASITRRDMQAQLRRLKAIAEGLDE